MKTHLVALRVAAMALTLLAALTATAPAGAQTLEPRAIPAPLAPWAAWSLHGKDDTACVAIDGDGSTPRCAWPARLSLDLDERSGKFAQSWHLDARRWVPLPGDDKRWPLEVTVDRNRAVVVSQGGAPSVEVGPGDHTIAGTLRWDSLPESLHVPAETGLLALTLRGAAVAAPNRDAQGTLWLQKAPAAVEGDHLELVVHRKVSDDVPMLLTTRVELHVSGKNREVLLGRALPAGFIPMSLDGPLPARVEPDGRLRVQARPGVFTLELTARSERSLTALSRPDPGGPWREGDEVWVFEAKNDDRVVTVEGVAAIDPQQTTIPDAWKRLPTYPMKLGDVLHLVEKRRGDADPPPNQLTLARTLWLDFDGGGYTVSDVITGTMTRDWRLTMAPPTVLGRVSVSGKDQFITHLQDAAQTGVEIRQGNLVVSADSRVAASSGDIPAVGWTSDFHQVSGTLHVPPGWRVVHATGVDSVPGTWIHHWSLLELFVALIIAIVIGRLFGPLWGVIALGMLALTLPESGAPKWIWLVVLAFEALVRALKDGRARRVLAWGRAAAIAVLAIAMLPFMIQHVREGLFPALANPSETDAGVAGEEHEAAEATVLRQEQAPAEVNAPPAGQAATVPGQGLADKEKAGDLEGGKSAAKPRAPAAPPPTSSWGYSSRGGLDKMQSNAQVYDPAAAVQTGPGLPRWTWSTLSLTWSGPVTSTQRLHLYLLSPRQNLVLALARVLLLVAVLLRLVPWKLRLPGRRGGGPAVAAAVLVALSLAPRLARADIPDTATLDDLRDRLTRKPSCSPACTATSRLLLDVRPGVLRARLDVDVAARAAMPLPGSTSQWTPTDVAVDGKPTAALARLADGVLWVELDAGRHQIALVGPMPDRESMQLPLHGKPHRVEVTAQGWSVEGVHEDGLADDDLQLTRAIPQGASDAGALQAGALPPFVRIERTLEIGLNWQVTTHIVRVTPPGTAVVLEVPLLAGESVTTADVRVVGGKALVNMGPTVTEAGWRSTLDQRSPVKLVASPSPSWFEVWRVDVGPIWHAEYAGIPFVHTAGQIPEWRPWPGEEATVALTRPEGVAGQTLTIDQSRIAIAPGLRATDVTLTVSVRSSRGAQHTFTLPPDAQLEALTVNGTVQPIRQDGRHVTVGVVPGPQSIALTWREPRGIAFRFDASAVDLGAPSVNATTQIAVPAGRWLLFASGPRLGPAVLFWSELLVLLVVALVLGRVSWTPLRTVHWMLLAIGLSQVGVVAGAFFVGWLLLLGWRKARPAPELRPAAFDLRQVLIVAWTLGAFVILGASMYQGLLGAPDMQVRGNGSTSDSLLWFSDRAGPQLPEATAITAPMLVYRLLMLAWALWAAFAVLRWIRWGWGAFTEGGTWKKAPPPPPRAPPLAPTGFVPPPWGPPPPPPPPFVPPPGGEGSGPPVP